MENIQVYVPRLTNEVQVKIDGKVGKGFRVKKELKDDKILPKPTNVEKLKAKIKKLQEMNNFLLNNASMPVLKVDEYNTIYKDNI